MVAASAPTAAAQSDAVFIWDTQCEVPESHKPERGGENLREEWIQIRNSGDVPMPLGGWTLSDEGDLHTFTFPSGFVLDAGASVRVRTGVGDDTSTDLYWDRGSAVWNNEGDTAFLRDASGDLVDSLACGGSPTPPDDGEDGVDGGRDGEHDGDGTAPDEEPTPVCVEGLTATPMMDRSIVLSWEPVEGASVYHVHQVVDGAVGPLVALVPPDETSFTHEDLDVGTTYSYAVAAEWHPTPDCEAATAVAIPFFPGAAAAAAGTFAAAGVYLAARRR